jgi:hypothetical protein
MNIWSYLLLIRGVQTAEERVEIRERVKAYITERNAREGQVAALVTRRLPLPPLLQTWMARTRRPQART